MYQHVNGQYKVHGWLSSRDAYSDILGRSISTEPVNSTSRRRHKLLNLLYEHGKGAETMNGGLKQRLIFNYFIYEENYFEISDGNFFFGFSDLFEPDCSFYYSR